MTIKSALIGYTGFVGSNLVEQYSFEKLYNSRNISEIDGQEIELVVCAGVSAVKWLANQEPQSDFDNLEKLKSNIKKAKIKHLVLISTIDIYDTPQGTNEDTLPDTRKQDYYGKHRYQLEQWVAAQSSIDSYSIIRLPGLFGRYLKKNLIFDIINPLAQSINKALWESLRTKLASSAISEIKVAYFEDEFGNLQQHPALDESVKENLVKLFAQVGFSTLNFTDSRSSFQFYNLGNLWHDITKAISLDYSIVNLSCEPITTQELVKHLLDREFTNLTAKGGVSYDMHCKYVKNGNYLYSKQEMLEQIKDFVDGYKL